MSKEIKHPLNGRTVVKITDSYDLTAYLDLVPELNTRGVVTKVVQNYLRTGELVAIEILDGNMSPMSLSCAINLRSAPERDRYRRDHHLDDQK